MSETRELSPEELELEAYYLASQRLKAGRSRTDTLQELTARGLPPDTAQRMVEEAFANLSETVQREDLTMLALVRAMAGAAAGALLGGVLWWLIMVWTGYEIGFIAMVVGWLAGLGTALAAKPKRGITLQLVAVAAAVAGIVIGNYLSFVHLFKQAIAQHQGQAAAAQYSVLSDHAPGLFLGSLITMIDGWNLLWIVLAIVTAWKMLKSEPVQLNREV